VGDDSEEGSWGSRANGQSATAAVNLSGDLESEESEEECEFTDGEDEEFEFNENAFQKLFAGANLNTTGSVSDSKGPRVHRYQRGPHTSIRTQQRAKREHMDYNWQQ
jgi:hypothetical protein